MKKYRINIDAFEEKRNKGGGSKPDYIKLSTLFSKKKEKVIKIYKQWKEITSTNGQYIFYIEYIQKIPPKTKRIVFNNKMKGPIEKVKSLDDVMQKGITTENIKNILHTKLYYQIDKESYEKFTLFFKYWINKSDVSKSDDKYIKNLKKIFEIDNFGILKPIKEIKLIQLVDLLPIEFAIKDLFESGILNKNNYIKDLNVAKLNPEEYDFIFNKYPNIIVSSKDVEVSSKDAKILISNNFLIDEHFSNIQLDEKWNNQPIGIIDSGIELNEEFKKGLISSQDLRKFSKFSDKSHGTMVASLIIANDELNHGQKDGFGNFRIKHFEMLEPYELGAMPSLEFDYCIEKLEEIISENKDIKIWNLSFGSIKNPYKTTVSKLGIFLDKISYKYEVIFVVSSGNDRDNSNVEWLESLNTPADSLNALTVGSVGNHEKKGITFSKYSSIGSILHFEKPEISYFGGPYNLDNSLMKVLSNKGIQTRISGTSFSAPRVSRMIAHYISKGYSPFEAKAKIINMSKGEQPMKRSSSFGYIELEEGHAELRFTKKLSNKKPYYLPIDLIEGTEEVKIATSSIVKPYANFGEEYSIYNFDCSLIWYDPKADNPEHENKRKTLTNKYTKNKKYQKEVFLRMENGKYFNSSKKFYILKDQKYNLPKGWKLALRIKKLDLFDTKEEQSATVSAAMSIFGNFDLNEFEKRNSSIIEVEQEIEQEILI